MINIEAADMRRLANHESRAHRIERGGMMNGIFDVAEDYALDGQVVAFNVVFPYKGDFIMLKPGCFGDSIKHRVGFWIDHEESSEVASTDDALELMIDDEGLQFRLDLGRCKNGHIIARMCQVDSRSAMSHGSDILAERREMIAGHSVRVVTRARLKELTACRDGAAGPNAFAMVVDKTVTPKPLAGTRSALFNAARTLHKASRAVRQLKAQVVATYGDHKPQPARRWTLDDSNREQSLKVEKLQEQARAKLA